MPSLRDHVAGLRRSLHQAGQQGTWLDLTFGRLELALETGAWQEAAAVLEELALADPPRADWYRQAAASLSVPEPPRPRPGGQAPRGEAKGGPGAGSEELRGALREAPREAGPYRELLRRALEAKSFDEAFCLCAALRFLGQADAEEQRYFEQHRTPGLARAQARVEEGSWREDLAHPSQDQLLSAILEAVLPAARRMKSLKLKEFGLKARDRVDPYTSATILAKTFMFCAQVLALPALPELYLLPGQPIGFQYARTDPPASVAGAQLLGGRSPEELTFEVARHLAYYRGGLALRWVEPLPRELQSLLFAAIRVIDPIYQLPPDPSGEVARTSSALAKSISRKERSQLAAAVEAFVQGRGEPDVPRWVWAIELTACRVGLLLCGDLEAAARSLRLQAGGPDDPEARISELLTFSVSEPYLRLRRSLGLAIS